MQNFAIDLTIVSPFSGVQKGVLSVSQAEVLNPNKRADDAAELKRGKFQALCTARRHEFVPFVIYTTGKLHKDADKFLGMLADYAAERRRIPAGTLLNYYRKLLAICLVNRLGFVISTKLSCFSSAVNVFEAFDVGNERSNEIGDTRFDT